MWQLLEKVTRHDTVYAFFCTTRFGIELINSKKTWFKYDLVWTKNNKTGHIFAKYQPMRQHEMIYIFTRPLRRRIKEEDKPFREYAAKLKRYIGAENIHKIKKAKMWGNMSHFFTINGIQLSLIREPTYDYLIKNYNIDKMDGFMNHKDLTKIRPIGNTVKPTYNPQKINVKKRGTRVRGYGYNTMYGVPRVEYNLAGTNGKGYPSTILNYNKETPTIHPCQKPAKLLEWLVKTYSNKGGRVLDFCAGSCSAGIACINTGREFIGIEMDEKYYRTGLKRMFLHEINSKINK
jgi:site-specific DNA-methyltransferase (adenine-specific)